MKRNTKKGFTLVELMVVIAIIAILATVSVVGYTSLTKKADLSNAQSELHQTEEFIYAALLTESNAVSVKDENDAEIGTLKMSDTTVTITLNANGSVDSVIKTFLKDDFKPTGKFDVDVNDNKLTYTSEKGAKAVGTVLSFVISTNP